MTGASPPRAGTFLSNASSPKASAFGLPPRARNVASRASGDAPAPAGAPPLSEKIDPADAVAQGPYDGPDPFSREYLWGLAMRQKGNVALGLVSVVICATCNLAAPVLTGFLFEALTSGLPMDRYWRTWATLAVVYTVEPFFTQVYIRAVGTAAEASLAQMRMDLFRLLLGNKVEFFDRYTSSELLTVLSSQLGTVRDTVVSNTSRDRGLRAFIEAAGSVVILVWLSSQLGPVMGAVIVASGMVAAWHSRRQKAIFAADARQVSQMVSIAGEAIGAIKTVRSCAGEGMEQSRFGAFVEASFDTGTLALRAKATQEVLIRGSIHFSLLLLFSVGGYLVSHGLMPVRALLSGIGFVFSLVFATQGVVNSLSDLRKGSSAIDCIREVVDACVTEEDVVRGMRGAHRWSDPRLVRFLGPGTGGDGGGDGPGGADGPGGGARGSPSLRLSEEQLAAGAAGGGGGHSREDQGERAQLMAAALDATGQGDAYAVAGAEATRARRAARDSDLVLRSVSFRYPARRNVEVLRGLDLTVARGKVTALVGRSGSGKTTVASLIAQLYAPDAGEVALGGVPVAAFSKQAWARAVALVSQEPALFTGTIADNIAYGRPGCTREEVQAAARTANAHEFVEKLPDGYDTVVGPQGTLLSGGQRQRIAVARALIKDAPILILDEATSALDAVSERLVQQALERLEKGRTVLVIAHRLSTVQNADKIAVVGDGRVLEEGTHLDLVKRGGAYAELVGSQRLAFS